eukprot:CAMPEP_0119484748 /NCGR_PEP_ID=MMETSP1344-20130328/11663_1 /TAXON_ID=236787 /ORGANISM="Florenciella parvula, Strain CCMP2471" /LENGTH=356 /DNA_ID=CAMNT_0007519361 /DNA_START=9 /DNA_END=1077 /DNA_ORIENTATION=+
MASKAAPTNARALTAGEWSATYTFSASTESHAGTTIHGEMASEGYGLGDMRRGVEWANKNGVAHELFELSELSGTGREAHVLVLRNAVSAVVGRQGRDHGRGTPPLSLAEFVTEFEQKVWPVLDRKFVNFQVVRPKWARGNAEIGPIGHPSTLAELPVGERVAKGQTMSGVVLAYPTVPVAQRLADGLPAVFGEAKASHLRAEINFYGPAYAAPTQEDSVRGAVGTAEKMAMGECGIGFHGDGERPDVIGVVLGSCKELHFQGFKGALPSHERVVVTVGHGDIYMMCEVACGHEWVKERRDAGVVHYRHAAGPIGGNKFTPSNEKIRRAKGKRGRASPSNGAPTVTEGKTKRRKPA